MFSEKEVIVAIVSSAQQILERLQTSLLINTVRLNERLLGTMRAPVRLQDHTNM